MKSEAARAFLDTDALASKYRVQGIDVDRRRLLLTNFHGTQQEKDLSEPPNCNGYGRIRHFTRHHGSDWPPNPLPIDPALKRLGFPDADELRAQVFQSATCNWRCWYCFVPFSLLAADRRFSQWLKPSEVIDLYLSEDGRPAVIDLTGGEPDLIPEWVPWMMAELQERGLEKSVYLWSDGNLSVDYFWRFLTNAEIDLVCSYQMYGRVGCFKGFSPDSFSFNTRANPELFDRQFHIFRRFVAMGLDVYAYVTLTTPVLKDLKQQMSKFVESLQEIDANLPLRTVPLKIVPYTPVKPRLDEQSNLALKHQYAVVEAWEDELGRRFSQAERSLRISEVPLEGRDNSSLA